MASFAQFGNKGLLIAAAVIFAVVLMAIVAVVLPIYLGSVSDTTATFNDPNATVGDERADALLPIFGLLVAFGGLFAVVALVFVAIAIKVKGGN